MDVKYQIFVSSTYDDLRAEREQVIRACLEMGHIPVGMEMFNAADEQQWEIIKRQIDSTDYYLVIVAHRYGSLDGPISFTEKEYDYAVSKGIPVLAFLIDEQASWSPEYIDKNAHCLESLRAFKAKLRLKPVDSWSTKEQLHSKCAIALMKAFNTRPRPGWIRNEGPHGPEIAEELSRLSSENAALREQLSQLDDYDTSELVQDEDKITLRLRSKYEQNEAPWEEWTTTWRDLFIAVAGSLMESPEEQEVVDAIKELYLQPRNAGLEWHKRENASQYALHRQDFLPVKTQFVALSLVKVDHTPVTNEKDPVFGGGPTRTVTEFCTTWRLTQKGLRKYIEYAAIKKR